MERAATPCPLTASASSSGAVLAPALAAVAVGVGAATGVFLAEAQEAVRYIIHLLRTRDISVTNVDGRLSDNSTVTYFILICKRKINLVRR